MLKEILLFLAGYSVGRSKSSFGKLIILGLAAYVVLAIYVGFMFTLGVIYMIGKYLYHVGLAAIKLVYIAAKYFYSASLPLIRSTHRILTRHILKAKSKREQLAA